MKFGIKEAQKAEVFAKTREQKETVLAVVSMMSIPIVLKKQVVKRAKKLNAVVVFENQIASRLRKKLVKAESLINKHEREEKEITTTVANWTL